VAWLRHGNVLELLCHNTEPPERKHFTTSKILEIVSVPWVTSATQPARSVPVVAPAQVHSTTVTATSTVPKPSSVLQWLGMMHMEQYEEAFESSGYTSTVVLRLLDDTDLDVIGVTLPGHRKLLLEGSKVLANAFSKHLHQ